MDTESILLVAEDLEYLATWRGDIKDPEIRRGSAVLRRLLVEDAYGHAWRSLGRPKQPSLIAVDLDMMLGNDWNQMEIALAGGASFRGVQMAAMVMHKGNGPLGNPPPEPIREDGYPFEREFTLSDFLDSTSGVVHGKRFKRREVIKYIANVKGGVHLSSQARKQEKKLIDRLGKAEKRILVHNTDGLLVEAVAIGQALGNSDDAKDFVAAARSMPNIAIQLSRHHMSPVNRNVPLRPGDVERKTKPLRGRFNSQNLLSSVQYQPVHCYCSCVTSSTPMPAHHLLHSLGGHESHGAGISTYHRGQS